MEDRNLLSDGVETLKEIRVQLLELQNLKGKAEQLELDEGKLEKGIQVVEKSQADETASTLKKRKQEIEKSFDDQIDKLRARIKKLKDKRDKRKSLKISERIDVETAALREANQHLKREGKTLLKQGDVPAICNTKLYHALYLPRYFQDLIIILCSLAFTLFVIPYGIYFFLLPDKIIYLVLLYIITVIVFGGIYLFIGNQTKGKHLEALKQVKGLKATRRNNLKQIRVIKKNIRKDRDESSYGLENFDQELEKLTSEEAEIVSQKKDALLVFENTTSQVIINEIKSRYEEKLAILQTDYQKVKEEDTSTQDKIKALAIKIASEYEPLIGKDLMTSEQLDTLINIMVTGNATTISEAILVYRQNIN